MKISDLAWPSSKPSVVAVGNFDGVHPGHQKILERLTVVAADRKLSSIVITFSPHPVEYFRGVVMEKLTTVQDRAEKILRAGVDHVFVLTFDEALAKTSAEDFIDMLISKLAMQVLILGPNSSLGNHREGTPAALEKILRDRSAELQVVSPEKIEGHWVSSSRIREALREGEVETAAALLGRPYSIVGDTVSGQGIARGMGTPTLNLSKIETLLPRDGVYVTRTRMGSTWLSSVTNIGVRPTFHDTKERVLETHLLDQAIETVEPRIEVAFFLRLRDERKFANAAELSKAIAHDIAKAREYFQTHAFSG